VTLYCSSTCATLFDFSACYGVHLVHMKRSIIQSMIHVWIQKHEYFNHFNFIILVFVCIFPLHAIILDVVSLFIDILFTLLTMLNDILYQFK